MADGAIQFYGDIDFRTGAASSVTDIDRFDNRSDIGGAKTILVTNGDNYLKRIVCVDTETIEVAFSKITGFTNDRNKTFTHVTASKPPIGQSDSLTVAGFTGSFTFLNGVYEGNVVDGYTQTSPQKRGHIETIETDDAGAIGITDYQWGIIDGDTTTTATSSTNIISRVEAEGKAARFPPYASEFTLSSNSGIGTPTVTATTPHPTGQVKWEMWLPRFQSIVLQKDSTDKIYIQRAVLDASNGSITHTTAANTVVTPITRMYKDTHIVRPLPGHSTTAAGKVNRTDLNKATCFLASTTSPADTSKGRCIVIADSAGNTISKTMIPGYSYMKIFKNPTDTVYCEESLATANTGSGLLPLVNMRFSPIGITN